MCRQKAKTLNPLNRMRPASVTKSQLSCLRSALDIGGVFVLVAVVMIGPEGGGFEVFHSFIKKPLRNSQEGYFLFPTTICIFVNISRYYCEHPKGMSENKSNCLCMCT